MAIRSFYRGTMPGVGAAVFGCAIWIGSAAVFTAAAQNGSALPPPAANGTNSQAQEDARMKAILLEKLPPALVPLPPPSTDPKDFEGTWIADQLTELRLRKDMAGNDLPLRDTAKAILDRRVNAIYIEHEPFANASAKCQPPGQPWQLGLLYPFNIIQTKSTATFMFSEYHTVWNVRMNAAHNSVLSYMGDSVGHWDGDTLIVDIDNFKAPLSIDADGTPASAKTHLTLRIRRINQHGPELEIITTVDDPVMFKAPFSFRHTYAWRPDMAVFAEYNCEPTVSGPNGLSLYNIRPDPENP